MSALMTTGTSAMSLMPTNINEAMKLADLMSKARLLPQAVQNPADAFLVINQAMRWGMDPFAVAQEVSVISGKLMHSGKIVAAAIQSSGVLDGRLSYDYTGSGDDRTVTVSGLLRGEAEPRRVDVRLRDARTQNKVWNTQPDQQLAYHGARVWARRFAPEVMLVVYSPEEMEPDAPRDVPAAVVDRAPPPARPTQAGGLLEHVQQQRTQGLPLIDSQGTTRAVSPGKWLEKAGEVLGKLDSYERVEQWSTAMREHQPAVPAELWDELTALTTDRADALAAVESTGGADGE